MIKRNLGPLLIGVGVLLFLIVAFVLPGGGFEYPALYLVAVVLLFVGFVLLIKALLQRRRHLVR